MVLSSPCRAKRNDLAGRSDLLKYARSNMQLTENYSPEAKAASRAISDAIAARDHQGAYEQSEAALARGLVHPIFFNARALWLERQGRDEEALADFERALSLGPRTAIALNAIGLCLTRLQRLSEAISAFDEAIRLNPTFTPTYHRKGLALGMAGDLAAAKRAHEQAVRLNPRDAEALGSLASLAARKGDAKNTLAYAERAFRRDPDQPTALAARAYLDNSEGRFVEAEQFVRPLLGRPDIVGHARAVALGILADSLDGQDRVADAFSAYCSENEELHRLHAPRFARMRSLTDSTRDLVAYFQSASRGGWQTSDDDSGKSERPRQHVFLLGFYRSGTTLLRQVLAAHTGVLSLEEHDFLLGPASNYLSDGATLARLATLSDGDLAAEREAYWRKVKEHGLSVGGKVFVDKQPLNTIKLPLIAKLFPQARIVFAIRDPRDVVLSCFRRHFEVNPGMFELLTLDGAAAFYDAVMQFGELMQPLYARPFFLHRYEDMITNFDRRVEALCDFLGLQFEPAMREFHTGASAREVRSPSASQVARKLYREGAGQWRRYDTQLAPVIPILRRWIEKFGYPAD